MIKFTNGTSSLDLLCDILFYGILENVLRVNARITVLDIALHEDTFNKDVLGRTFTFSEILNTVI